jgi:hypothetical protein
MTHTYAVVIEPAGLCGQVAPASSSSVEMVSV